MSWSLSLQYGDLVVRQASLETVTSEAKLVQDLTCFILEKMGTDDMHPGYGSLIDGGQTATGYQPGVIGTLNDNIATTFVRSEMNRICSDYQAAQLQRAKNDQTTYGKATLSRGEVLLRLNSVGIVQTTDTMIVTLNITTGNNADVDLTFPL